MAEEVQYKHQERKSEESGYYAAPQAEEHSAAAVEATDRGLFDFGRKKEEEKKGEGEKIASEFEKKVQVCEDKKEDHHKEEDKKKHEGLLEKLHRSSSSSSSSSEEDEVGEDGQKKKKKKEKTKGEHKEGKPVEKCEDVPIQEPEEKKGLLGKIKEKLPGGKKAEADAASPPPTPSTGAECAPAPEAEGKEKKGFLDKIKDKIPGYHSKSEEEKEKEKEAASH